MRLAILIFLAAALCLSAAEKKKGKLPDLEVVKLEVHRTDGKVMVDGRVRNAGEKKLEGVIVFFDFLATGDAVITTQRTALDEEVLEPGGESVFQVQMVDPVRAVECRVNYAEDKGGRDLRLSRSVKVPIE